MLTQQDLERRRKFITATDTPALLGVSPWVNAADVFIQKTQGVDSFKGNDATDAGNRLEASVIAWAADKLGPLNPGDWCVHENGLNACTLDAMTVSRDVVEAKTTGIVGPGSPHQWGEEGSDEIPDYYLVQVQAQMLVTGARRAFVPTLIGGRGFVMYVVLANVELQEVIRTTSERFWQENVLAGIAPEGVRPSLEILKRMHRKPGTVATLTDDVAEEFIEAQGWAKLANESLEAAKSRLIASLGDAEGGQWGGGEFTYYEQSRKEQVTKASTFRVLRHKAAKARPKPATILERVTTVDAALLGIGYLLKDESESGSRYYCGIGLPDIRVADHEANEATSNWMDRKGVIEIRVDRNDVAKQLSNVMKQLPNQKAISDV